MVDPYDEERVATDDAIIRRISPEQHVVWDDDRKRYRISTKAYSKSSGAAGGMSVDIEALILAANENPRTYVTTPVYTGSVAFPARDIRALDLMIGYEPVPGNPYHGEVWMKTAAKKFSTQQTRGLVNSARWYVELPNVDIV